MLTKGNYFDDVSGYLNFEMSGGNSAYIFTEGKVIPGYWLRGEDDSSHFVYYDSNAEEVVLNQGKTWICLIWNTYEDNIAYE